MHSSPLLLSVAFLLTSACASAPDTFFDDQRASDVYVEPDADMPRARLRLEVAAPQDAGLLTFHVALDGREVLFPRGALVREIDVHPGAIFVDVTVTRDRSLLNDSTIEPQRQMVPCGRGRFCERTVMVPRIPAYTQVEEQLVCKRSVELSIAEGGHYRVHVSSDGVQLCRIVCSTGDDEPADTGDCVVDEN